MGDSEGAEMWTAVDQYWNGHLLDPDPVLDAAREAAALAGLPDIEVSAAQGKLLHLLARAVRASRILEIGTLGGYSTIWLARALEPEGTLVTCEIDPRHAEVARANLARAGLAHVVQVEVGSAMETLERIEGPFDLAFIDADKAANAEYLGHAVRLCRPGALIVVDNVVRRGAVLDASSTDAAVVGTRRLADALAAESRLDATVVQTVGAKGHDGFLLALVG